MASDISGSAYIAVIKEIFVSLKLGRGKRVTAKAAHLMFWDDGMLKELRSIAAGETDRSTIRQLREKFEISEGRVHGAIGELLRIRDKLGASNVARQIDAVVNSADFGKGGIREDIRTLLGTKSKSDAIEKADHLCRKIEILRTELARLNRMVNES